MSKTYQGEGNIINVVLGADATAGVPIVIGTLLGVPITDGLSGETIAVAISGVYDLPAVNGAAFIAGQFITWDVSANAGAGYADDAAATPAAGDLTVGCIVVETVTAGSAGQGVAVKLNVGPNTVT